MAPGAKFWFQNGSWGAKLWCLLGALGPTFGVIMAPGVNLWFHNGSSEPNSGVDFGTGTKYRCQHCHWCPVVAAKWFFGANRWCLRWHWDQISVSSWPLVPSFGSNMVPGGQTLVSTWCTGTNCRCHHGPWCQVLVPKWFLGAKLWCLLGALGPHVGVIMAPGAKF